MVVDDDPASLESTTTILALADYEVRGAQNGAIGLEEVITFRPEVVVFDFWMPVADGRDLLQGIREVARERLGLVAISGHPEVEDWCARVGVGEFVRKPFDRDRILSAVGRALDEARTSSVRARAAGDSAPPSRRSSSMLAARRLKVERAVLVVGDREAVRPVRALLRDGARPMQVAVVEGIRDAVRALGGFKVDAVAVCGKGAVADPELEALIAEASGRGLPVVLDRVPPEGRGDASDRSDRALRVSFEPTANSFVDEIQAAVAGVREAFVD